MEVELDRIIQGDALSVLKTLPDNSVDLLLTDPPYGIKADKNKRANTQYGKAVARSKDYGVGQWDDSIPERGVFEEMRRVSKNQVIFWR